MATTKSRKIRKQVYELTAADLREFPVWEFALDEEGVNGQDELTVRPYSFTGVIDPKKGLFVVEARFFLADGTQMVGYLTPPESGDENLGTIQPVILTKRGQVSFWSGLGTPSKKKMVDSYTRLGRNASQIFPVRFKSNIEIEGGSVEGRLNGFLYLETPSGPVLEAR